MASKREQILEYLKALLSDGLPGSDVQRNRDKARTPNPMGDVIIRDGDPGDPERRLSARDSYFFEHPIPIEVEVRKDKSDITLDDLLGRIADLLDSDPTLGGLSGTIETSAASPQGADTTGTTGIMWTGFFVTVTYATPHPFK